MPKQINWTKYITAEAIYRFWYILENNNFKHEIKKLYSEANPDNKKPNYSSLHNALYSGLYYPEMPFEYGHRTIVDIRNDRKITGTIANFMTREEILKNIHAMYECADFIRKCKISDYNEIELFAKEIYLIGAKTTTAEKFQNIDPKLVLPQEPSADETAINGPKRYRLAKKLAKELNEAGTSWTLSLYTREERKNLYEKAYTKYARAKKNFENVLKQKGFEDASLILKLEQALNSGFYKTIIPFFGFNIDEFLTDNEEGGFVKLSELEGNAKKFKLAIKQLTKENKFTLNAAMKQLVEIGTKARETFINDHRTFPECFEGFLNEFCNLLAKVYVFDNEKLNLGARKEFDEIANEVLDTIKMLTIKYEATSDVAEKKQIEEKFSEIQNILKESKNKDL